jgi:MoaA/NifB/PqqE/SkfB family radical SAM enzyme
VNNSRLYINGCLKKIRVCDAGKLFFQIDPYGGVYSCPVKIQKLGNVNGTSLKEILNQKNLNKNNCKRYFQCTAGISYAYRANFPEIIVNLKNFIRNN